MLCCCLEEEQSPGPNALPRPASPAGAAGSGERGKRLALSGRRGGSVGVGALREKTRGGTVGDRTRCTRVGLKAK